MRLHAFRGPGLVGLSLSFALLLAPAGTAFAQQMPSADIYRGPQCFNTVIPDVVATVARITGARMPGQEIFSVGDELFVELAEGPLEAGTEYLVYRIEGSIRHPQTGAVVGDAVNLLGRVHVLEVDGTRGLVEVTGACAEIEAGDRLHPLLANDIGDPGEPPIFDPVHLITPDPLDATVVFGSGETLITDPRSDERRDNMTERATYMLGEVVTIDQGRGSGWAPGSWGMFYNDGLPVEAAETVRLAGPVTVAQGYVLWSTETTAALMITESEGAVMLGNRARPIR